MHYAAASIFTILVEMERHPKFNKMLVQANMCEAIVLGAYPENIFLTEGGLKFVWALSEKNFCLRQRLVSIGLCEVVVTALIVNVNSKDASPNSYTADLAFSGCHGISTLADKTTTAIMNRLVAAGVADAIIKVVTVYHQVERIVFTACYAIMLLCKHKGCLKQLRDSKVYHILKSSGQNLELISEALRLLKPYSIRKFPTYATY